MLPFPKLGDMDVLKTVLFSPLDNQNRSPLFTALQAVARGWADLLPRRAVKHTWGSSPITQPPPLCRIIQSRSVQPDELCSKKISSVVRDPFKTWTLFFIPLQIGSSQLLSVNVSLPRLTWVKDTEARIRLKLCYVAIPETSKINHLDEKNTQNKNGISPEGSRDSPPVTPRMDENKKAH